MTNTELLKEKIKESGLKVTAIAEKTGINRVTLYNKISGKNEFTASEIVALSNLLGLTTEEREAIFFAAKVE